MSLVWQAGFTSCQLHVTFLALGLSEGQGLKGPGPPKLQGDEKKPPKRDSAGIHPKLAKKLAENSSKAAFPLVLAPFAVLFCKIFTSLGSTPSLTIGSFLFEFFRVRGPFAFINSCL